MGTPKKRAKTPEFPRPTTTWVPDPGAWRINGKGCRLEDVGELARELLGSGESVICPIWGGVRKWTAKRFNAATARSLIAMYWLQQSKSPGAWLTTAEIDANHKIKDRAFPNFLVHWGLVAQNPEKSDERKRTSSEWRVTKMCCEFVEGRGVIPLYMYTFQNEAVAESEEHISIQQALRSGGFDYRELMAHEPPDTVRRKGPRKRRKGA